MHRITTRITTGTCQPQEILIRDFYLVKISPDFRKSKMLEAATINFTDLDSRDRASVIVRYDATSIALCLSQQKGGDIEVLMSKQDARLLLVALQKAID